MSDKFIIHGQKNLKGEYKKFQLQIVPEYATQFYGFLVPDKIFKDKNVRLAFNHALDRVKIADYTAKGEGVPKDATKAVEWWEKAAAQGNVDAQHRLGVAYLKGEGVTGDKAKAEGKTEGTQKPSAEELGRLSAFSEFIDKMDFKDFDKRKS